MERFETTLSSPQAGAGADAGRRAGQAEKHDRFSFNDKFGIISWIKSGQKKWELTFFIRRFIMLKISRR